MTSSPSARFRDAAAWRRRPCGSMRSEASFRRCGRVQGIGVLPDPRCGVWPFSSSRRGSGSLSRRSPRNSRSFRQTAFPRARIGRASPAHGLNGSIKRSPSFSVSEEGSSSASDAAAFQSINASSPIRPIEPGAADPGRGTGSAEREWANAGSARAMKRHRFSFSRRAVPLFSFLITRQRQPVLAGGKAWGWSSAQRMRGGGSWF